MPDLMGHEFIQIREAVDIAWELLSKYSDFLPEEAEKVRKIEEAKELMADLAAGNSR